MNYGDISKKVFSRFKASFSIIITILIPFILTSVNLHYANYLNDDSIYGGIGLGTSLINIVFSLIIGIN